MLCLHSDFHPRNTTFLRSVFRSPAVTRHAPVPVSTAATSARSGPQALCTAYLCVFLSAAMSLLGSRNMVQALLLSLSPSHSFTLLSGEVPPEPQSNQRSNQARKFNRPWGFN